ncbi:WD-repeat protein, putative [Ricinus communis]|uniref:WD-repeat protein, putative n=1 Tax=Ricinus communis TaxID=3988 RepID=B9RU08_RICCO|nr:WD-repeat protein, putative [Ricinus communis]|eukprot:XP_002517227.1 WD repeat-containing protein YMR102C [Ricinus communis]
MLNFDEGEDDLFFDSVDCLSPEESIVNKEYEIWLNEPQSVKERRQSFLCEMGLTELACKSDNEIIGLQRISEFSGAVSSSSSLRTYGEEEGNLDCCGRESNSEANCMIDDMKQYQLDKPIVGCENENSESLTSVSECDHSDSEQYRSYDAGKQKMKSWWKFFVQKRKQKECTCVSKISELNSDTPTIETNRIKVKQNKKRCMEFTGVYMQQELRAHKGFIWTMKFSPDGQYLATGGEDGIVRIWQVTSVNGCQKSFASEDSFDMKEGKSKRKMSHASVVIPERIFQLEESPVHEFYGHSSDVLDLAWSNSNCLLSSSKDKTVRLWQVGSDHCLNIFHHISYVTCIQFNPVNENYFISGSIDGKVRIWGVCEQRVVDWVDAHDVTSAICYQPDGKGFVVGSITGTCRFYEASGNDLQLGAEIHVQGRKRTAGNRITGIQFSQERPQRVMISSEDSKLRILDGVDIVHKYKGLPKSGSQMSASFTSGGKHIISVGEDCRVYVWDYDELCTPSSKHKKSVRSCEHFFSEGVSIAVPWSGMRKELKDVDSGSIHSRMPSEEGTSRRRDSERFSLGNWFFIDGPCRGSSATWPEEKLPHWDIAMAEEECQHQHYENFQQQLIKTHGHTTLPNAWGLVIATAGWDGTIRTFHNYGLPVRL